MFLSGRAVVTLEPLKKAAFGCIYRVNNCLDHKCRPRPAQDIVDCATKMTGRQKTYEVLRDNSKKFVIDLRYGRPRRELVRRHVQ